MKLNKFTVVLAILLVSILAIGAVSAESVDDSGIVAVTDGDIQESVDVTDTVDDLSTANNADEIVNDDGGAAIDEGTNSYDLDDDTYSKYFNDDGTAKEVINESSDYTLNVGTLTNKDIKINYGSNINIVGKEGAGFINNGTIYLDGGADGLVGSVTISGLTFTNTNKGAIDIAEYCTDINFIGNTLNIVGDSASDSSLYSVTAIAPHSYIYGLKICDNNISVTGDLPYLNGIYSIFWPEPEINPSNFEISGNTFLIDGLSTSGSLAAIYIEANDLLVDNNNITVKSRGDSFAYGIQVPDTAYGNSMDYTYEGDLTSPNNIKISNNDVNIESEYMAYGITTINYGCDGDYYSWYCFPLNIDISSNTVFINSKKGVMGIAGQIYMMNVIGNNLTIIGGSSEGTSSQDMLKVGAYALGVQFNAGGLADDDFIVNVKDNIVLTNVTGEFINADDWLDYVTFDNKIYKIQDDEGNFIVTPETFDIFFDENGNPKDTLAPGSTILLNGLANKKFNINIPLNIKPYTGDDYLPTYPTLNNCVINLVEGADGSNITGLIMFNDGENADYTAIIKVTALDDITIDHNKITANGFVGNIYGIEVGMSDGIGCNNLRIADNNIVVSGSRYVYGIDVWGWDGNHTGVEIVGNEIEADGSQKMAEALYLNYINQFKIAGNGITASNSGASAYGIGADNIFNGIIEGNGITADSRAMAYGITDTNSDNVTIKDNTIRTTGEGAIAIGLANTNDVNVTSNIITAKGGNYLSVSSGDYLIGKGNEAIYDKSNNVNLIVGENDITTNFPVFIDNDNYGTYFNEDGTIKEDVEIDSIVLNDLTGKKIVVDRPLTIKGTAVDTTIDVITGAEGTIIKDLKMKATVSSGSFALIHIKETADVTINGCTLDITCNNDLSGWDMIMPIQVEGGATGCDNIIIAYNNITVTGAAPYVYGIDAYKTYNSEAYVTKLYAVGNNIYLNVDSQMTEGIYASGLKESGIYQNVIESRSTNSAYGMGTDSLFDVEIENNDITVNAGGMAYGITATMAGKNLTIATNNIDATGTGAMGIGLAGQDGASIVSNEIAIEGGDYTTLVSQDVLGVGNAAVFEGAGNTNINIADNKLDEYTDVKLEVASLTVTGAPSGQGTFKVTLKTIDGKALANKEITFSFNNKVIKVKTDANGIAKFSFNLNKAAKYPVSVAFLGDKHYKGAFTTATITVNPIKTKITAPKKTFKKSKKVKKVVITLKNSKGKALAKKKITLTVNKKKYTVKTNSKGKATFKIKNLKKKGTFKYTVKFAGDSLYKAVQKKGKIKVK